MTTMTMTMTMTDADDDAGADIETGRTAAEEAVVVVAAATATSAAASAIERACRWRGDCGALLWTREMGRVESGAELGVGVEGGAGAGSEVC